LSWAKQVSTATTYSSPRFLRQSLAKEIAMILDAIRFADSLKPVFTPPFRDGDRRKQPEIFMRFRYISAAEY